MNKIATLCAILGASLMSTAAMAQAYVGGNVGLGHVDVECGGIASCDNNDTAIKVYGGYGFGNGFAGEVGYVSFGKATASEPGFSSEIKVAGLFIGAAYHAPLSKEFGLSGRVGLANLKTDVSGSLVGFGSFSDSDTNVKPYFGLAANYALTPNLKIEVAADFSRAEFQDDDTSVRAITAGVRYEF